MTMFVNACTGCPPGPFWTPESPLSSHPSRGLQHPNLLSEAAKRTSFFISDILHPSVIPLPGTLPQSGSGARNENKSPAKSATPPTTKDVLGDRHILAIPSPPTVRSCDLKFGIDRILNQSTKDKRVEDTKDRSFMSIKGNTNGLLNYCSCASTCGPTYPSLSFHRHLAHAGSNHHQSPNCNILSAHNTQVPPSMFPSARPSDFPGPYAILGSADSSSSNQSQPKRKRSWSRAVFSNLQRKGLEKRFEVQKYVTKPDRRQLAAMLGLTDAQVKVWFQNRRMKWRHQEEAKRKKDEDDKKKKDSGEAGDDMESDQSIDDTMQKDNDDMNSDDQGDEIIDTSIIEMDDFSDDDDDSIKLDIEENEDERLT